MNQDSEKINQSKQNHIWHGEHNEKSLIAFPTCPPFLADLFEVSGEHELSWWSSSNSSSFLMSFSMEKLDPCRPLAFLAGFVLLPVMVDCVHTLGVLTTKDESDLSFLLAGNSAEETDTGAFSFLFLKGKILFLKSCKMLSGLVIGTKTCNLSWNKLKEKKYFFNRNLAVCFNVKAIHINTSGEKFTLLKFYQFIISAWDSSQSY